MSALQLCCSTYEGPDTIHYCMLQHLSPISLSFLLAIFSIIWTTEYFPSHWLEALVLPFLKSNKFGTLLQDYHPIAMTNCLCKLLERMVKKKHLMNPKISPSFPVWIPPCLKYSWSPNLLWYIYSIFFYTPWICTSHLLWLRKGIWHPWWCNILQQLSSHGIWSSMGVLIKCVFHVKITSSISSFPQFEGVT